MMKLRHFAAIVVIAGGVTLLSSCTTIGDDLAGSSSSLTRMTGPEIRQEISGFELISIGQEGVPFVPFRERFSIDGEWLAWTQTRSATTASGRWNVQLDLLCVTLRSGASRCRRLYKDASQRVYLTSYFRAESQPIVVRKSR